MLYLEKKDVPEVILNVYPEYRGTKFKVETCESVSLINAYWDGGSRTTYQAVNLDTGGVFPAVGELRNPFRVPTAPTVDLPPRTAIVAHSIFCGKDMGITIYARPEDIVPKLPAAPELTEDQETVLIFTKGLKPSYNGISNYRFHEATRRTGITLDRWEAAKASLIEEKYLNKRGAITPRGRNAIGDKRYY